MGAMSSEHFQSLTAALVLILLFSGKVHPEHGLYHGLANVETVNSTQLEMKFNDPNTGKLVLFFNNLFGDSQRYVSTFSDFARTVYKWQRLLRIFAIDCGQEHNVNICRMYDVKRTPSLRYFSPNHRSRADGLGEYIGALRPPDLLSVLKNKLKNIKSTPKLGPVFHEMDRSETVKSIFRNFDLDVEYLVLVYDEKPGRYRNLWWWNSRDPWGRHSEVEPMQNDAVYELNPTVLLDLLPYRQVRVRYLDYISILRKLNVVNEKLAIVDRFGNALGLSPDRPDKESYVEAVIKILDFVHQTPQPTLLYTIATAPNQDFLEEPLLSPGLGNGVNQNEASLYNKDDNVVMLDSESLPSTLSLKSVSKLVQFLNTFCGDCRRFAPIFKSLSRDLYQWRRVLRIYAVDCAQERNVQVCRKFDIRQTPTLRYFSSELAGKELGLGVDIPSQDPKVIVSTLADLVSKDKYESPGQPNFGFLQLNETLSSLFKHDGQAFVALVYQPKDSKIGRDSILSLLPYDQVAVRVFEDYRLLSHLGILPSNRTIFMIDRKGKTEGLSGTEGYQASIGKFLESRNYKPVPPLPEPKKTDSSVFLDQQKQAIIAQVLKHPRKIYRADLEQAIDKLLHIELPKALFLRGDNFTALHSFLRVLSQLNPLNKNGKVLLLGLDKALAAFNETSGSEFAETVDAVEKPLAKVFKGKRYVGCVASKPFLRGFTCSLWSLFHYLTVEAGQSANQLPPGTVLSAIHGFVKYFFGCSDCSNHFQEMAKRRRMDLVKTHDEEILWLWAGHNEVNERLSGDATEDPQFPKIQFPSPESCPSCRNNASVWQTEKVLLYLKSLYGKKNLSFYGLPTSQGYD